MAPKNKKAAKAVRADRGCVMAEEGDADGGPGEGGDPEEGGEGELRLEEVLKLGGTRADFALLATLDDSNELVDGGKKGAIDDLEEGELERFITKLGFQAFSGLQVVTDTPGHTGEGVGGGEEKEEKEEKEEEKPSKVKQQKAGGGQQRAVPAAGKEERAATSSGKKSKQNVFEFTSRQTLLIKPGGKWFELEYTSEGSSAPQDAALVSKYKTLAQQLLEAEEGLHRTKKNLQKGANSAWMKTVVSSGVLADRMAAMTVLIQDAPVHTLEHVESLVTMMSKKGNRRVGLMAMDTLRELLLSTLLPEHRKLRPFTERPFHQLEEMASGNRDTRDRRLTLWYFEHRLKLLVAEFVQALGAMSHDTVPATKTKALAVAHELLCSRPEQERALLTQVVNKLGDPEYKTAAKASYLLETLLHQHPNMKAVVCGEVERLVFRPNVAAKAQYYAVCFLSQVMLSHEEMELAAKLITVYFSFFRACVKKKDVDSKMLSALLSGVNRAYPYAGADDQRVKEQMDTLFRVIHLVKFNTAVQALMLLFQVMDAQQSVSDRYYVALYRKLLDPGLLSSSRQSMFLNLLYKSLKADVAMRRVKAFVKRLLQVGTEHNASFTCGALFLVSEVMRSKPGLRTLLQESRDAEEETFKDIPEDEDECFVDADKLEEGKVPQQPKPAASWVHQQNLEGMKSVTSYEPLHRNPLYCGADHSTLWELHRLRHHFHPSVALFAKTILQGESVQYSGDPLQDFTLIRFLDRFVFRNPKQIKGKLNTDSAAMMSKNRLPLNSLPVNGEAFLSQEENQVPVDQVFFHRFFKKRQQDRPKQRKQRNSDEESVEEVDDDEFEKILDSVEGDSFFCGELDDGLDFAGNMKGEKKKKKGKSDSDEDDDSDEEDGDDLDDEEVSLDSLDEEDFGDKPEEDGGMFMDVDGHEEEEEEEEEEEAALVGEDEPMEAPQRKRKSELSQSSAKRKKDKSSMFASAEEFGSMLDNNSSSKLDNIGVNAMSNSDRAGLKQLKWEAQRDDWIRGRDVKTLRRRKAAFNRKKRLPFMAKKRRK